MNLFDVLETAARYVPEKDAVRFQEDAEHIRTISYRRILELAVRFSAHLAKLGVQRGDRVAVFLPNIAEYPIITYGALRIGAIPVLLSSALKGDAIKKYMESSGANVLVVSDELYGEAMVATDMPKLIQIIGAERTVKSFQGMHADYIPPKWDLEPDDPAFILYTSGTTGEQKGAVLSHGNVISNIRSVGRHTRMTSDDVMMCFLPLFHCFGQNFVMNATFNAFGTLVLHKRFVQEEILASLQRHKVTMFFSIPPNYRSLLELPDVSPFESVRYFFTAADKMPGDVVRAWEKKFGKRIYEGWGLTETSPFATYNHDTAYAYDTVGTPIEYVDIKIVDEDGTELKTGEVGEIVIRGPNVFKGYFNNPEATREAIRDGWFFTGDIGKLDEKGYLEVIDRKNDRIKVSGFSVWPREIENFARSRFGGRIQDIGVIGVPDDQRGEMPFAYVARNDPALTEQEIMDAVGEAFPGYCRLKGVRFCAEQIPKTPTGKILKKELRKRDART